MATLNDLIALLQFEAEKPPRPNFTEMKPASESDAAKTTAAFETGYVVGWREGSRSYARTLLAVLGATTGGNLQESTASEEK
jgi:hypothetical protein